ncbi:hypothetical protein L6452_03177 [Arctium lappa]|uniref:Uncharacterized protein n=1 Tax=Arctium lappa TaxID=4217 RepID=A0ACB9FM39_ARCLA|nr:hypothetical protein L6452_03177 [Arctium lappa]
MENQILITMKTVKKSSYSIDHASTRRSFVVKWSLHKQITIRVPPENESEAAAASTVRVATEKGRDLESSLGDLGGVAMGERYLEEKGRYLEKVRVTLVLACSLGWERV